jgi:hypothetical protein
MFNQAEHNKEKVRAKPARDDYNTPKEVWKAVESFIPKDILIYEPFWNDTSHSDADLREMGCQVISRTGDFFTDKPMYSMVVTNPPFSKMKQFVSSLDLEKPFLFIAPLSLMMREYFSSLRDKVTIIVPRKRIQFEKGGELNKRSPFDVVYITNLKDNQKLIYIDGVV